MDAIVWKMMFIESLLKAVIERFI